MYELYFSLVDFNTLSVLCIFIILTMICHGKFFYWSCLVGALCAS